VQIQTLKIENLKPAPWRSNYVQSPEMKVLADSIIQHGWLYPIVVSSSTMEIIDGFHRWVCAQNTQEIIERDGGRIPCILVDVSEIDAMLMHIQLNRPKGSLVAKKLSNLLRSIVYSRKYEDADIQKKLMMTSQEFYLLLDGTLLKGKKLSEHTYSRAWVPIEAPAGAVPQKVEIEKPPNADR
jgi:ParB-like chromosome segregation protein Spo0J